MKLQIPVSDFSIKYTFESAQPLTFYADFDPVDNSIVFPYGNGIVRARFSGNSSSGMLTVENVYGEAKLRKKEFEALFRINDDMQHIYSRIASDRFMESAINRYRGMRLTLNDPWVTTLAFLVSQFNNIKRIRRIVKCLMERFGDDITYNGTIVGKTFPSIDALAHASVSDISRCGAGFRAEYIKRSADYCLYNINLEKLKGKSYEKIKQSLLELRGVGDKVADCIALMGYGKLEAFPIDTWIKRTVENIYFNKRKKTINEIHKFAEEKWDGLAGYAQQYLYWHGMHYLR